MPSWPWAMPSQISVAKYRGAFAARLGDPFGGTVRKGKQVGAARVAVPERAFNHHLRFGQVLDGPSHPHAERVHFGGNFTNFLAES